MSVAGERNATSPVDDGLLVACVRWVLERQGLTDWQARPDDFWCMVHPPEKRSWLQGWKLHISATPLSAPVVLARSAEVLLRHRCPFKFATTLDRVRGLVSRQVDRSAGGKFITAYPECDGDRLRALAEELHRATEGLPGPGILSDRPYRPGSLVHYRYGVFGGLMVLDNDGSYGAMLVAPDGNTALDPRKPWFTPPPWAPRDPFAADEPTAASAAPPKAVLLDGRYEVREVIRHSFTGGVYRATDQSTGAAVIIKQARPHTGSSLTGQDVRSVRRREAEMLRLFEDSGLTPRLVGQFEQQGDVFVAQEAIPGVTLRQWVAENVAHGDGDAWGPPLEAVAQISRRLLDLVELVHARGLVLRDFTPTNVMVTGQGELRLIDLELLARPDERVARAFTLGYGAPEQVNAPPISPTSSGAADLYNLGATLFFLATGVDPVLLSDQPEGRRHQERLSTWLDHLSAGNVAARRLAGIVLPLMHEDPAQRPRLDAVRAFLAGLEGPPGAARDGQARPAPSREPDLKRLISDGIGHLVQTMDPANPRRLWPSQGIRETSDPLNVQYGAAGVLGVFTRAYQGGADPALRDAATAVAGWIGRMVAREPRLLPGLYFGRSGTAWALLDAGLSLGNEGWVSLAVDIARRIPLRAPNPDICHGMAGAGLTQLRFWEATGKEEFLARARQAADAVMAAAEPRAGNVRWPIPRESNSRLAGAVHYGFAHGVAGAGAFLLAMGRATGEKSYLEMAAAASSTLVSVAQVKDGAAYWATDEKDKPTQHLPTHWCSGSSGVGTFLARMWQESGDARLLELAIQAAAAVRRARWRSGMVQCHGLAGDAEFLLDLAQISGEERFRDWAAELAACISLRHALREGRMVVPDETGNAITADFGAGLSGVVAFLLRFRDGGARLWLPEALNASRARRRPEAPPSEVRAPDGPQALVSTLEAEHRGRELR